MTEHSGQWLQMQKAFESGRMPQAMLFVAPLHCALADFAVKTLQLLVCKSASQKPCGTCPDCQMAMRGEHPDGEWVKPEKKATAIKVDQIRALQQAVYLTPQRSAYRVIVIEDADYMNTAAANALLKILEEPPKHTLFILIAQQVSTILPTVLSRCQLVTFTSTRDLSDADWLQGAESCSMDSDRALVLEKSATILDELIQILEGRQHPCTVSAQWVTYELSALLWFLYNVYAQIQYSYFISSQASRAAVPQLKQLAGLLNPLVICNQLDKINAILSKLSHNIHRNHLLVLDELLCSLTNTGS